MLLQLLKYLSSIVVSSSNEEGGKQCVLGTCQASFAAWKLPLQAMRRAAYCCMTTSLWPVLRQVIFTGDISLSTFFGTGPAGLVSNAGWHHFLQLHHKFLALLPCPFPVSVFLACLWSLSHPRHILHAHWQRHCRGCQGAAAAALLCNTLAVWQCVHPHSGACGPARRCEREDESVRGQGRAPPIPGVSGFEGL